MLFAAEDVPEMLLHGGCERFSGLLNAIERLLLPTVSHPNVGENRDRQNAGSNVVFTEERKSQCKRDITDIGLNKEEESRRQSMGS